jgi:hypothetical protein
MIQGIGLASTENIESELDDQQEDASAWRKTKDFRHKSLVQCGCTLLSEYGDQTGVGQAADMSERISVQAEIR